MIKSRIRHIELQNYLVFLWELLFIQYLSLFGKHIWTFKPWNFSLNAQHYWVVFTQTLRSWTAQWACTIPYNIIKLFLLLHSFDNKDTIFELPKYAVKCLMGSQQMMLPKAVNCMHFQLELANSTRLALALTIEHYTLRFAVLWHLVDEGCHGMFIAIVQ